AKLREEKLSFMNEQTGFDNVVFHGFDDFVEGQNDRFKIRLKELQREISGSFQTGHANAQALELLCLQSFCGDNDGAVAFAEAGASIEEDVGVAQRRIGGEAEGGDVVGLRERGFVQRLDIGEDVSELVPRCGQLVGGQGVKHESVVGIGRVSQLDLAGFLFGLRCRLSSSHRGKVSSAPEEG